MQIPEDKRRQLQCRTDAAIAKRNRAAQMKQEAEEELIEIRIEWAELEKVERDG